MNDHDELFYEIAAREIASKQFAPGLMVQAARDRLGWMRSSKPHAQHSTISPEG